MSSIQNLLGPDSPLPTGPIPYNPTRLSNAGSVLIPLTDEESLLCSSSANPLRVHPLRESLSDPIVQVVPSVIEPPSTVVRKRERSEERTEEQEHPKRPRPMGFEDVAVVASHYNARPNIDRAARRDSPIIGLKNFNNWVKSVLIAKFVRRNVPRSQGPKVLDLGCGKGGDLQKWSKAQTSNYVGIDLADISIEQARGRFQEMQARSRTGKGDGFFAEFFAMDCFEQPLSDVLQPRHIERPFDVVSMQFCVHYAFENENKARRMLENVTCYLAKGGLWLGTMPDSRKLMNEVREIPKDQDELSFGNEVYRVQFDERALTPRYGHRYSFFLKDAVDEVPEYVVHWDEFVQLAAEYGLELEYREDFHNVFLDEGRNAEFANLLTRMRVVDEKGDAEMSDSQWEAANFYTQGTPIPSLCFVQVAGFTRDVMAIGANLWVRVPGCCPLIKGRTSSGHTVRSLNAVRPDSKRLVHRDARDAEKNMQRDLILSVLEAHPSARDSRFYLKTFAPNAGVAGTGPTPSSSHLRSSFPVPRVSTPTTAFSNPATMGGDPEVVVTGKTELADELLQPISQHTALVKIQGPFTDRQLESIAEGMVYLKKLGLVSIIVMDNEEWSPPGQNVYLEETPAERMQRNVLLRERMKRDTLKFTDMLEARGGEARPLLEGVLCIAGATFENVWTPIASTSEIPYELPKSDLFVDSLSGIRDAIRRGEIPVIPPIALDASCFSLCVSANDAVRAISSGLVDHERRAGLRYDSEERLSNDVDLTPVRIMVINREGGIPSPARGGDPHLSINIESEFENINSTFVWHETHPTSLANLALLKACLAELPRTASAVLVSHRSPRSLIANLITNKPAHSPSLHPSLLRDNNIQHQPTIVRRGLPIRVFRSMKGVDQSALTRLLEASFGQRLESDTYYDRLERSLDFIIIAGDYEGVAIVTNELPPFSSSSSSLSSSHSSPSSRPKSVAYLDKFAVLPSLQGDGTVDFLWGALRDESFGLGLLDALNPNVGGLQGKGVGRDLVWRSRSNNPVNKWYFERSNGFFKIPPPVGSEVEFSLFWCEAEDRLAVLKEQGGEGISPGRLQHWSDVVRRIPSCWKR